MATELATDFSKNKKGFSLIEIILSVALFALIMTAIAGFYLYGEESSIKYGQKSRALAIAEQSLEAIKNIKDAGFELLPNTDGDYKLEIVNGKWQLTQDDPNNPDTTDIFTRKISITTIDEYTKKFVITITQNINGLLKEIATLTTRFTNWAIQTIFGFGNWGKPLEESSLNYNIPINQKSKIYTNGDFAYLINDNRDGADNFSVISISDTENPILLNYGLKLPGTPSDIAIFKNIAYVASDNDGGEIQMIKLTESENLQLLDTYHIHGAQSIYIKDDIAYVVNSDKLTMLHLSEQGDPPLFLSSISVRGYDVYVSGNYAYITHENDGENLKIVDISDPTDPQIITNLGLLNGQKPSITGNGNVIVISQDLSLFTIDISDPTNPHIAGKIDLLTPINDVAINLANESYCFVANDGVQIIDISSPIEPILFGKLDIDNAGIQTPLSSIYYDINKDRVFAISDKDISKFRVIKPSNFGDWSSPSKVSSLKLPNYNTSAKIYTRDKYAYIITNNNTKENFTVIDIDQNKPIGYLPLNGTPSDIAMFGKYIYVTSNTSPGGELQTIDISDPSQPRLDHVLNLNNTVDSLFIKDGIAYTIDGNKLVMINLISGKSSYFEILQSGYNIYDIYVSGNYLYAASDDYEALLIFDIADIKNPIHVADLFLPNLPIERPSIAVSENTVIMSRGNRLFTIDVSTKTNPQVIRMLETEYPITDIAVNLTNTHYCFITETNVETPLQIINITPETTEVVGSLTLSGNEAPISGVYYDRQQDKAFIVGGGEEFMIIIPETIE